MKKGVIAAVVAVLAGLAVVFLMRAPPPGPGAAPVPVAAPALVAVPAPAPVPAGPAGSIEGTLLFTGAPPAPIKLRREGDPFCAKTPMYDETVLVKDGKLANVYVRISRGATPAQATAPEVVMDQVNCMYRPRVMGAMKGQKLIVKNSDKTLHNVHTYLGGKTVFNRAMPPVATMPPIEHQLADANVTLRFQCDVHPWMKGYVHLTDHPYFAVSGEDGAFRIAGVPPGSYTLEAVHERFGAKTVDVTIEPSGAAKVALAYTGAETAAK